MEIWSPFKKKSMVQKTIEMVKNNPQTAQKAGEVIIGVVTTIAGSLKAPKSGKETREELMQATKEAVEKAKKEENADIDATKIQTISVPSEEGWKTIASWKGKGKKNTENFTANSLDWRLRWSTHPESEETEFVLSVCDEKNSIIDEVASVKGCDENSSHVKKAGVFYLKIDSGQPYYIVAEERLSVPE